MPTSTKSLICLVLLMGPISSRALLRGCAGEVCGRRHHITRLALPEVDVAQVVCDSRTGSRRVGGGGRAAMVFTDGSRGCGSGVVVVVVVVAAPVKRSYSDSFMTSTTSSASWAGHEEASGDVAFRVRGDGVGRGGRGVCVCLLRHHVSQLLHHVKSS